MSAANIFIIWANVYSDRRNLHDLGECLYDLCVLPPQERHLFTGTVLTPDGDHYKVQFDRPKQGVQVHACVTC